MKRSSNTDGDKSSPDKKAKATQSSSLETQKFFSDSSSSSSSSSSSPMQEELQKYEEAAKKTKQIEVEQDRLRELKEIEMRKLIRLFVNRPYKPYSSDESFYNALQLTNLVVGVRRNCKYAKELSRAPPYSYLKDTTNPRNYYMSKNELHAHMALQNLVDYQAVRNRPNGIKKLRRKVALRGEFVQTNHIQQWECGFCKQPIAPAVTSCHTTTTFPSWTRCEQEENNICLNNAYSSKTSRTEEGEYLSEESVHREWSTVVDISIKLPSFKLVPLSFPRSPLSKTLKHVIF